MSAAYGGYRTPPHDEGGGEALYSAVDGADGTNASNSPAFIPPTKSTHCDRLKNSVGPSVRSFVSRIATPPSSSGASSTHWPFPTLALDFRHSRPAARSSMLFRSSRYEQYILWLPYVSRLGDRPHDSAFSS